MAHGQWTEVEALGMLEAWKRSGVSIEKLAAGRGLTPQRLYGWKRKLRFGASEKRPPQFLPMRALPSREMKLDAARRSPFSCAADRCSRSVATSTRPHSRA